MPPRAIFVERSTFKAPVPVQIEPCGFYSITYLMLLSKIKNNEYFWAPILKQADYGHYAEYTALVAQFKIINTVYPFARWSVAERKTFMVSIMKNVNKIKHWAITMKKQYLNNSNVAVFRACLVFWQSNAKLKEKAEALLKPFYTAIINDIEIPNNATSRMLWLEDLKKLEDKLLEEEAWSQDQRGTAEVLNAEGHASPELEQVTAAVRSELRAAEAAELDELIREANQGRLAIAELYRAEEHELNQLIEEANRGRI